MLTDAANIQEKDAEYLNKRSMRRRLIGFNDHGHNGAVQPLYTIEDAQHTFALLHAIEMHTSTEVGPGVCYESFDAGHMLGSTSMMLELKENSRSVRLVFSGDVGRPGLPIIRDPEVMPPADVLIIESTYGDRFHQPAAEVQGQLKDIVNRTYARGGKLIVPAFAVGRTQQLVLMLHELINAKAIPEFPIFVDSPLAVNVTEVFRKHPELFDPETRVFLENGEEPFGFRRLRYLRDVQESKALNDLHVPVMIIAASGMCEAGRILHHLKNNIEDPRNTVLLTGYQAENTLGRKIEMKLPQVPVFGEMLPLLAEVQKLDALSGHADQGELLKWMKPIAPTLKRVFLVHGEGDAQPALADVIHKTYGVEVVIPNRGQSFAL
jgi:metallo-beta-lactamase family protein